MHWRRVHQPAEAHGGILPRPAGQERERERGDPFPRTLVRALPGWAVSGELAASPSPEDRCVPWLVRYRTPRGIVHDLSTTPSPCQRHRRAA
eukprot:2067171-Prymnesium_polylepis.1